MGNKKILAIVVALAIVLSGLGFWAVRYVKAATTAKTMTQNLADKLGISEDKVSTAMKQIKEEKQAERLTQMSTKLDKAVSDGVITADQKQKILDKTKEQQQKREQERQEMEKWQSDNNIDFSKLRDYGISGMGMMGGKGHGGPGECGMMP